MAIELGPMHHAVAVAYRREYLTITTEAVYDEGLHIAFALDDEDCTDLFSAVLSDEACHLLLRACGEYLGRVPKTAQKGGGNA